MDKSICYKLLAIKGNGSTAMEAPYSDKHKGVKMPDDGPFQGKF